MEIRRLFVYLSFLMCIFRESWGASQNLTWSEGFPLLNRDQSRCDCNFQFCTLWLSFEIFFNLHVRVFRGCFFFGVFMKNKQQVTNHEGIGLQNWDVKWMFPEPCQASQSLNNNLVSPLHSASKDFHCIRWELRAHYSRCISYHFCVLLWKTRQIVESNIWLFF